MASGYFPLSVKHDNNGKKLKMAADLVDSVLTEMWQDVNTQDQIDNAASDGGAMAMLSLSHMLIMQQLKNNGENI